MGYDYKIASEVLTEVEKNRILCLYLNCDPQAIDWEKATTAFGAASVASMRVSMANTLKKIEKAGGKIEGAGTPMKATPKSASKKRKGSEDVDDDESTPTKKRGKAAKTTNAEDEWEPEVKAEVMEGAGGEGAEANEE